MKAKKKKKTSRKALSIVATAMMTFSLLTPGAVSAQTTANQLYESFRDSNSSSTFSSAREKPTTVAIAKDSKELSIKFSIKREVKQQHAPPTATFHI